MLMSNKIRSFLRYSNGSQVVRLGSDPGPLRNLMQETFDLIRDYCGEVCDTTISPSGRGKYFDVVKKHIDCNKLFGDDFIEGWDYLDAPPPALEYLVLAFFPFFAPTRSINPKESS